jgi:hypothetical protein
MNDLWKILTLFFLGSIVVLVVTHAKGFSLAAGTLFTGVNSMATILTGSGIPDGGPVKDRSTRDA